ncbi:hypothetical protein ACHAW5_010107 [Stephanodiscus triporus]|uniref:WAP domain-containing protein n=1 Tax=Stephanodiscus triporus TaxID=2934178 RepID=A0ABD3QBR0_9STRA
MNTDKGVDMSHSAEDEVDMSHDAEDEADQETEDPTYSNELGSIPKPVLDEAVRRRRRMLLVITAVIPLVAASTMLAAFTATGRGDTAGAITVEDPSSITMEGAAVSSPVLSTLATDPPSIRLASTPSPTAARSTAMPSLRRTKSPTRQYFGNGYVLTTGPPLTMSSPSPPPTPPPTECVSSGSCDDNVTCCSGICKQDGKAGMKICKETSDAGLEPEAIMGADDPKEDAAKPGSAAKPGQGREPEV